MTTKRNPERIIGLLEDVIADYEDYVDPEMGEEELLGQVLEELREIIVLFKEK